jgi:hypothetical protein
MGHTQDRVEILSKPRAIQRESFAFVLNWVKNFPQCHLALRIAVAP